MTPRPDLGSVADELYQLLEPFATRSIDGQEVTDEQLGWPLLTFWGTLIAPWQEIDDIVRDRAAGDGYSPLFDVQRIADKGLPWLGQLGGVVMLPGLTPDDQRLRIEGIDGINTGTPDAIAAAARRHLEGAKTVLVQESPGGNANVISIVTYTAETPDPDQTLRDIEEQTPWWIKVDYNVEDNWNFQALSVEEADFGAVRDAYDDFRAIRDHQL